MASKPENGFIGSIHRHLKEPFTYHEKMNNPFRSGTPDVWYSGHRGDLWVEYKFIPYVPQRSLIKPDLSDQQKRWIANRRLDGRNVAVIVGCKEGGVIFLNGEWNHPIAPKDFKAKLLSRIQIAQWIVAKVGVSSCDLLE